MVCSGSYAKHNGFEPIAKITAQASYAHDPAHFTTAPIGCIKKLFSKTGLSQKISIFTKSMKPLLSLLWQP